MSFAASHLPRTLEIASLAIFENSSLNKINATNEQCKKMNHSNSKDLPARSDRNTSYISWSIFAQAPSLQSFLQVALELLQLFIIFYEGFSLGDSLTKELKSWLETFSPVRSKQQVAIDEPL